MLKLILSMSDLRFSDLMKVYSESNTLNGVEQYGHLSESEQLNLVEMDFYHYLHSVFFHQDHSFYAVWEESDQYYCALRIEPYQNGFLLCALETLPSVRQKGYARKLIQSVIAYLNEKGSGILYSHISKKNKPSLAVHIACGFEIIQDYAVYSDGSVMRNHYTLTYKYKKSEIL